MDGGGDGEGGALGGSPAVKNDGEVFGFVFTFVNSHFLHHMEIMTLSRWGN